MHRHCRRAARQILDDVDMSWGQQVAVMFLIACALALDVPEVLRELEQLRGVLPNVQLSCETWGYLNHEDQDCICCSSDRTGAYIHKLSVSMPSMDLVSAGLSHVPEGRLSDDPSDGEAMHSVTMRPGSVPYVSQRAGAYGRLLLAKYVRWQTGLASDTPGSPVRLCPRPAGCRPDRPVSTSTHNHLFLLVFVAFPKLLL